MKSSEASSRCFSSFAEQASAVRLPDTFIVSGFCPLLEEVATPLYESGESKVTRYSSATPSQVAEKRSSRPVRVYSETWHSSGIGKAAFIFLMSSAVTHCTVTIG